MRFFAAGVPLRPAGTYVEAIGDAWRLFRNDSSLWIAVSLIVMILDTIVYVPFYGLQIFIEFGRLWPIDLSTPPPLLNYIVSLFIPLFPAAFIQAMGAGLGLLAIRQARGEAVEIKDLFDVFGMFPALAGAMFLYTLAIYAGFIACIIPAFYIMGALSLSSLIIADQKVGAIDALKLSFQVLKSPGQAFGMVLVFLALGLLLGFGSCITCGIGLVVLCPIYHITLALHYLYFFPPVEGNIEGPAVPVT